MKKFTIRLLVFVLSITSLFVLSACDKNKPEEGATIQTGIKYSINDDGNAVVESFSLSASDAEKVRLGNFEGIAREYTIPSEYEGKPVVEIADNAFANQSVITKLVIPASVTRIGANCMSGCINLTELEVPFVGEKEDSVNAKQILGYWFGSVSVNGMTSTTMNFSEGSNGSATYYFPKLLKKITVTKDVISEYAFNGTALETVILSSNTKKIGNYAFSNMSSLMTFEMPAKVEIIGKNAFAGSKNLYTIDFSKATQLKTIYQNAFDGCSQLGSGTAVIELPASVTTIYSHAFANCTSLKTIDLTALTSLEAIPSYCFYGCEKLETIKYDSTKLNADKIGYMSIPESTTVNPA